MGLQEDLDRIAMQERELVLPRLDADIAWQIGSQLARHRRRAQSCPSSSISAASATRSSMPPWTAPRPTIPNGCAAKSNVVARFHHSSYAAALNEKLKGKTIYESQGLPLADYATHGGSFPLRVADAGVVGSITVSGLPMRQDHELVIEALCAVLGRNYQNLKLPPE